jgi:hypothetical protein
MVVVCFRSRVRIVGWELGGACAFLKLAQWDFNNFIPASTGVYENYGGGEPHGRATRRAR